MDKPISVAYQWGTEGELFLSFGDSILWKVVPDIKGQFEVGHVALYRAESPGVGPVPANELQWVEITDDNYKQYPLLELGKVMHASDRTKRRKRRRGDHFRRRRGGGNVH